MKRDMLIIMPILIVFVAVLWFISGKDDHQSKIGSSEDDEAEVSFSGPAEETIFWEDFKKSLVVGLTLDYTSEYTTGDLSGITYDFGDIDYVTQRAFAWAVYMEHFESDVIDYGLDNGVAWVDFISNDKKYRAVALNSSAVGHKLVLSDHPF